MESDERETPTRAESDFLERLRATERCPLYGPGPTGRPGVYLCELGLREKTGARLGDAVLDALAALQWTDPDGPFTREEAARRLTENACRAHREAALVILEKLGPEWTPVRGVPIKSFRRSR